MNAYWGIDGDSAYFVQQKAAVRDLLATKHHFGLTNDDWAGIWYVWDMFYSWGLPITYNSSSNGGGFGGRGGGMPDYYTLMTATDGAGVNRSYLANEANWRVLKDLEVKNLLVPVVGDFGGPSAIRRVSGWLKERNATVTALYASNVEQYLWQDGKAYAYYDNVAQLPIDSTTVWIRSNGSALGRGFGGGGAGGMRSPNLLCPVQQLLDANKAGQIYSYQSIFNYCY